MPPSRLKQELERVGGMINRWKAELKFILWSSGVLAALWVFSLTDLYLQYERVGRILTWLILIGLIVALFQRISKALAEKHSVMGLAALVEIAFPQLDNHLINFLQFSDSNDGDPFKKAYVQRGVPEWSKIQIREMKDKKWHKRANLILGLAIVMIIVPFFFNGDAWGTAIWRIINPFSNVKPVSLTNILAVEPGDTSALVGTPLMLTCKVEGMNGHKVQLDIKPSDDEKATFSLGNIAGKGEESFSYRVPKVNSDLEYRFRAGDSPSPQWYKVKARVPLAVSRVDLKIIPPAYTGAQNEKYDGLTDDISVIQGSQVEMLLECNSPLVSATAVTKGHAPVVLSRASKDTVWSGLVQVDEDGSIKIAAKDKFGEELESIIKYSIINDKPPVVDIISPKGRTMLPPGTVPMIDFAVVDDYGLAEITVEKIVPGSAAESDGKVLKTWQVSSAKDFTELWKDEVSRSREKEALAYRIIAKDNRPGKAQVAKSSTIMFNAMDAQDASKINNGLSAKADLTLSNIINLQRENITATKEYQKNVGLAQPSQWVELSVKQEQIRTFTKELLSNPLKPLGSLTDNMKLCYLNEMLDAINFLRKVPEAQGAERGKAAQTAINTEEKILRALTVASSAAQQVATQQKLSAITAMLSGLIKNQAAVIKSTEECLKTSVKVAGALVDKQENLGSDLVEFINACDREAIAVGENDAAYADALRAAGQNCKDKQIKEDMMVATEKLDTNKAADAIPVEQSALAKLKDIRDEFEKLKVAAEEDRLELMQDAFQHMKEQYNKVKDLQGKALESMEMVDPNLDKNNKKTDEMEEEYMELVKNNKDAMLQVPIDLQIFLELAPANDLVEDVVAVFQEVEQKAGSEDDLVNGKVDEFLGVKEATAAEEMEQMTDRIDDLEAFLDAAPDTTAVLKEALDKEEMPPEGIALGALQTQTDDLIGDLLKESEDPEDKEKADDAPINNAVPDMEMGGPVMEGDTASFAAKGKSGNEAPDHKEQDGRSNVGRQGMSNGECAAGSGTIGEGDKNIDARRTDDPTQSGQVDVDGEADTNATGGGKKGTGKADAFGEAGGTERMDSTEAGSVEGLKAMMSKVESLYAQANVKNIKSPSLDLAAHHVQQLNDAIAAGRPLEELAEFKKRVIADLKKASTELSSGASMVLDSGKVGSVLENVVDTGADNAPAQYKDVVAEYYKSLNDI